MSDTLFYKRSTFVTHLPVGYRYSPSHFWLEPAGPKLWKIGFTKFATRMLGEIVDHQWEKVAGDPVNSGEILGSVEGFKAISDLYCVAIGTFVEGNPILREDAGLINKDPYGKGWLYIIEGEPDSKCVDLNGYKALLDATIDRILENQHSPE